MICNALTEPSAPRRSVALTPSTEAVNDNSEIKRCKGSSGLLGRALADVGASRTAGVTLAGPTFAVSLGSVVLGLG
jgi:hypothetical protein